MRKRTVLIVVVLAVCGLTLGLGMTLKRTSCPRPTAGKRTQPAVERTQTRGPESRSEREAGLRP